jgi:hypothetical protein
MYFSTSLDLERTANGLQQLDLPGANRNGTDE